MAGVAVDVVDVLPIAPHITQRPPSQARRFGVVAVERSVDRQHPEPVTVGLTPRLVATTLSHGACDRLATNAASTRSAEVTQIGASDFRVRGELVEE